MGDPRTTSGRSPATSPALPDERVANLAENPYAGQGSVLLDIGGDIGALVLRLPPTMEGLEIEIAPADDHRDDHHHHDDHHHDEHDQNEHHLDPDGPHRPHVAVTARPAGDAVMHSAVFPELGAGHYDLNERSGPVRLRVEVVGGQVTEATWPQD
ncbi:hypothetical protein [Lapillicoccus sp.]|uniref:hypothetical protein n=1 Tax=Lapillicoccus sp. TaxID=1909287 RepID=UPI0039837D59